MARPADRAGLRVGNTAWRRLREWQRAGVWERLHQVAGAAGLVAGLPGRGERAGEKGGDLTGANPTDRGKPGSKYHILVDAGGVPLAALLSAANTHDSKLFEPLLDATPAVKGRGRGRPRRRPGKLHADKGYDFPRCRAYLRRRGSAARIARRSVDSEDRLGRVRWVVERTVSWLVRYKRLGLRYDRSELTMQALLTLACAHLCHKILMRQTEL